MIRAIIFDCFGVLCHGSLEHLKKIAPPENVSTVSDVNTANDYGFFDHEEYAQRQAAATGISREEFDRIQKSQHFRNEAAFTFARELAPDFKLGLLSNVAHGMIETLFTADELTNFFTAVVVSGDVGMAKPYPEIFDLTAKRLGVSPEECVMIDDISANVDGARLTGMQGIVFTNVEQTRLELKKIIDTDNA